MASLNHPRSGAALRASARPPSESELAEIPWLLGLTDVERERALAALVVSEVQVGEQICRIGRPVTYWFGLLDGLLKMSNDDSQGAVITFTGVAPGGWFGEGTVLKREIYRYNIQALRKEPRGRPAGRHLPLVAGPLHRLQPVRDEPPQRAAGSVHRGARDRPA